MVIDSLNDATEALWFEPKVIPDPPQGLLS